MAPARYAYLHTRVSGLVRHLLPRDAIEALIAQPAAQEADVLQRMGVRVSAQEGRPLEQQGISLLLADLIVLVRPLSGADREFFLYWAHRFELGNLKTILRGKMTEQPMALIRDQLVDMGPLTRLPVDDLLRAEDVAEMLRRLVGTPFAEIAREARRVLEQQHELFALDAALDRRYYAGLAGRAHELERRGHPSLRALMSGIIDRINIVWLLRYRFGYDLAPAETYYLLIPATYRVRRLELLNLAQLPSFGDVVAALPEPFRSVLAGAGTAREVAIRLERMSAQVAEGVLHHERGLARAFAYLILRERDLRQTQAVLRGKRLRMPPDLIREAIGLRPAA